LFDVSLTQHPFKVMYVLTAMMGQKDFLIFKQVYMISDPTWAQVCDCSERNYQQLNIIDSINIQIPESLNLYFHLGLRKVFELRQIK
jgi:hypothetical protein